MPVDATSGLEMTPITFEEKKIYSHYYTRVTAAATLLSSPA